MDRVIGWTGYFDLCRSGQPTRGRRSWFSSAPVAIQTHIESHLILKLNWNDIIFQISFSFRNRLWVWIPTPSPPRATTCHIVFPLAFQYCRRWRDRIPKNEQGFERSGEDSAFQKRYTVSNHASALLVWLVFPIVVAYARKQNRWIWLSSCFNGKHQ